MEGPTPKRVALGDTKARSGGIDVSVPDQPPRIFYLHRTSLSVWLKHLLRMYSTVHGTVIGGRPEQQDKVEKAILVGNRWVLVVGICEYLTIIRYTDTRCHDGMGMEESRIL